ncbi:TetR family transcriptional regulator C-terminal domain-containing protein [Arthrobacter sp. JSM 101049]|uniref:TetR family transcriptional regulator C-terminal domain-containing protein n=1 Tax=Arthrobacter sp. JSM 101049 TaxID=929097 RepID=UPI00356617D9
MPTATTPPGRLPDRARDAIRGSGLPQRRIAELIGLDESKLSKSLKGTRRFNAEEITQLATVTGVTANWLISGSDATTGATTPPPARMLPTVHREDRDMALKRRTIIEKSWWLFAEQGYETVRIADIARECSMSPAAVHYYFPAKREIFAEVLRYSVKLAFDRQVAELHAVTDPVLRLKRLIQLQLPAGDAGRAEWSIWLQTWAQVAVHPEGRDNHTHGYRRWRQTVLDLVADGQRSGSMRPGDPDSLALDITTMMDGLGIKVLTGMLTVDQMYQQIESFIDRTIVTPKESTHEP